MLVQAISDNTLELRIVEKSIKVTRYVGGLLLLLSGSPLGGRLKALGAWRQPIWVLYAVRDLSNRDKPREVLLFRSCFLIGYLSRQLQPLLNWSIFDTTRQVSKISPFLVLYLCGRGAYNASDKLSLIDNVGEVIATSIDDAGLIPHFPGIGWVEVAAGLSGGTASLARAILEKRAQHQA
jgi:hypothetical protein